MIKSSIRFLARDHRYSSEKPYTLRFTPNIQFPRSNIETENRNDLPIDDVRGREGDFTLERNGFTIMPLETKLSYDDFDDEAKVVDIYLREVADGVRNLLGAKKVQILEHIVRYFPLSSALLINLQALSTRRSGNDTQISQSLRVKSTNIINRRRWRT